jgi:hypothetical protein
MTHWKTGTHSSFHKPSSEITIFEIKLHFHGTSNSLVTCEDVEKQKIADGLLKICKTGTEISWSTSSFTQEV